MMFTLQLLGNRKSQTNQVWKRRRIVSIEFRLNLNSISELFMHCMPKHSPNEHVAEWSQCGSCWRAKWIRNEATAEQTPIAFCLRTTTDDDLWIVLFFRFFFESKNCSMKLSALVCGIGCKHCDGLAVRVRSIWFNCAIDRGHQFRMSKDTDHRLGMWYLSLVLDSSGEMNELCWSYFQCELKWNRAKYRIWDSRERQNRQDGKQSGHDNTSANAWRRAVLCRWSASHRIQSRIQATV